MLPSSFSNQSSQRGREGTENGSHEWSDLERGKDATSTGGCSSVNGDCHILINFGFIVANRRYPWWIQIGCIIRPSRTRREPASPPREIVGVDEDIVFDTVVAGICMYCDHLSVLGMRERDGDRVSVTQPRGDSTEWTTSLEVPADEFVTGKQCQTADTY